MDTTDLRSSLASLHQQLTHNPALDAESRQLLLTVLHDIEQLVQQPPAGAALAAPAERHRVTELVARFDADHPALAAGLRQLVDTLGKLGI